MLRGRACSIVFGFSLLAATVWRPIPRPPQAFDAHAGRTSGRPSATVRSRPGHSLASEEQYKSSNDKVKKGSNTLAVLCLVLAQHDTHDRFDRFDAGLDEGRPAIGKAKDYAAAKTAMTAVDEALAGKGPSDPVPVWGKVASQGR